MCVRVFSGINTDLVKTNSPHGEHRPIVMQQNLISDIPVGIKVMGWMEFRVRL